MSITTQEALTRIIEHREIFHDEMLDLMRQIMGGQLSPGVSSKPGRPCSWMTITHWTIPSR